MLKGDSLRAALEAALPDYRTNPDRLVIFAEKGRVATRPSILGMAADHGFEYRYDLRVILLDFAGHPDLLILPVLKWIAVNQPDLLQNRATANQAITFEAEMLSGDAKDIELVLPLTEAVRVTEREDGGVDLQHLDEPGPVDTGHDGNPILQELFDPIGRIAP